MIMLILTRIYCALQGFGPILKEIEFQEFQRIETNKMRTQHTTHNKSFYIVCFTCQLVHNFADHTEYTLVYSQISQLLLLLVVSFHVAGCCRCD